MPYNLTHIHTGRCSAIDAYSISVPPRPLRSDQAQPLPAQIGPSSSSLTVHSQPTARFPLTLGALRNDCWTTVRTTSQKPWISTHHVHDWIGKEPILCGEGRAVHVWTREQRATSLQDQKNSQIHWESRALLRSQQPNPEWRWLVLIHPPYLLQTPLSLPTSLPPSWV